jgi:hypothetical protein
MKSKQKLSRSTRTRLVPTWLKLILLIFVPLSLEGCASAPTVLTEFETVPIPVPVRTPLSSELLQDPEACTLPPTPEFYFFDLDVWAQCLETQVVFYAAQLEKVRRVNAADVEVD